MKEIPKQFFVLHLGKDRQGQDWLQIRDQKLDLMGRVKAGSKGEMQRMLAPSKLDGAVWQNVKTMTTGALLMIRL